MNLTIAKGRKETVRMRKGQENLNDYYECRKIHRDASLLFKLNLI